MIIIGIDPGTANTGYGIIEKQKSKAFKCLGCGLIKTYPSSTAPDRLKQINNELGKLIQKYQPESLVIEKLFFFRNLKTAIPVSQASGVIMLCAAKKKIPVYQFTPLQVKMTIAGHGWAEKKQVQKKVKAILKLKEFPGAKPEIDNVADALAVALTYFKKKA